MNLITAKALRLTAPSRDRGAGNVVATKKVDRTADDLAVGRELRHRLDTLTGVSDADYKPAFPLTAKLNKLTGRDRPQLSPEDIKKLQAAMREKAQSE